MSKKRHGKMYRGEVARLQMVRRHDELPSSVRVRGQSRQRAAKPDRTPRETALQTALSRVRAALQRRFNGVVEIIKPTISKLVKIVAPAVYNGDKVLGRTYNEADSTIAAALTQMLTHNELKLVERDRRWRYVLAV